MNAAHKNPFEAIAQRTVNAEDAFIEMLGNMHNYSSVDAAKILRVYRKLKCVKLDAVGGRYTVKHGAFLDREVCDRALAHA